MKKWNLMTATATLVLSTSVNAAIISTDWQSSGDNLITQDTDSGLEWLDLTATSDMSYNDVSAQLGTGGTFEGWRYATQAELAGLWDAFGGDGNYDGWSEANNGLFDAVAPYVGDLLCESDGCAPGEGNSFWLTSDSSVAGYHRISRMFDAYYNTWYVPTMDLVDIDAGQVEDTVVHAQTGSALVRDVSPVPVPAAVWLFGSGLLGLIGVARRKAGLNL